MQIRRGELGAIQGDHHFIPRPPIFQAGEAQLMGNRDPTAMEIVGALQRKFQVGPPVESRPLILDDQENRTRLAVKYHGGITRGIFRHREAADDVLLPTSDSQERRLLLIGHAQIPMLHRVEHQFANPDADLLWVGEKPGDQRGKAPRFSKRAEMEPSGTEERKRMGDRLCLLTHMAMQRIPLDGRANNRQQDRFLIRLGEVIIGAGGWLAARCR